MKPQLIACVVAVLTLTCDAIIAAQAPAGPAEEIARRQLDNGRTHARAGRLDEAIKDFTTVVASYPATSVADDAWLEIGRIQFSRGDLSHALDAAKRIVKDYSESDSVPDAYILSGRVTRTGGKRQDLDAALADFERAHSLLPNASAVPSALLETGDTLRLLGRHAEALQHYLRVVRDYPDSDAVRHAQLGVGMTLQTLGEGTSAMEAFQRIRDLWPESPEAALALNRQTILYRLAIRAKAGPPFVVATDRPETGKLADVRGLAMTPTDALYYATESGIGSLMPQLADPGPAVARPRGVFIDGSGRVAGIGKGTLQFSAGRTLALSVPRTGREPKPLDQIDAVVVTARHELLVADDDQRDILRFSASGQYVGLFASGKVSRLAVAPAPYGDVAAIDRGAKDVVVFNLDGQPIGRIPSRAAACPLRDPVDLAYDAFGNLYVLAQDRVCVFDRRLQVVSSFKAPDRSPDAFRDAVALAVDSMGRLYIADKHLERVRVYR